MRWRKKYPPGSTMSCRFAANSIGPMGSVFPIQSGRQRLWLLSRSSSAPKHVVEKGVPLILVVARTKKNLRSYHPLTAAEETLYVECRGETDRSGPSRLAGHDLVSGH